MGYFLLFVRKPQINIRLRSKADDGGLAPKKGGGLEKAQDEIAGSSASIV